MIKFPSLPSAVIVQRCSAKRTGAHTVQTAWAALRIIRNGTRCAAPLTLRLSNRDCTGVETKVRAISF